MYYPRESSRDGVRIGHLQCERSKMMEWMHIPSGEIGPLPCNRVSSCLPCAVRKTRRIAKYISQSHASLFVTVTGLGDRPERNLDHMQRLVHALRQREQRPRWAWIIEPHRHSTGCHAHAYVRLDSIIDECKWHEAASVGGLSVHIKAFEPTLGGAEYAFKEILAFDTRMTDERYRLVEPAAREAVQSHLNRNSGRLCHFSRGFLLDAAGQPRTLEQLERPRKPDDEAPSEYIVYPASQRDGALRYLRHLESDSRETESPE